ncbi:MAG: right-handed parallel beta-helix repeat-containing protein, partial [Oceanobacter sp.]
LSLTLSTQAFATSYFASPDGTGDGCSFDEPSSLTNLFETENSVCEEGETGTRALAGGDQINLLDGDYGYFDDISGFGSGLTGRVTIKPVDADAVAKFDFIDIDNSSNLKFSGIKVQPDDYTDKSNCDINWKGKALFCIRGGSSNILIEDSVIDSGFDLEGQAELGLENLVDFYAENLIGIALWDASNIQIQGNKFTNQKFSIQTNPASDVTITNNHFTSIWYGLHGHAIENATISNNYMKGFIKSARLDENDNLITSGGVGILASYGVTNHYNPRDITVSDNTILPYDMSEIDTAVTDYMGIARGIYAGNGALTGWKVERNLVGSTEWHSVTLYNSVTVSARYNLEVDVNGPEDKLSSGLQVVEPDTSNSRYAEFAGKIDHTVECNIATHIGSSDPDDDTNNTVIRFAPNGDWTTTANAYWPEGCDVELGYSIVNGAF